MTPCAVGDDANHSSLCVNFLFAFGDEADKQQQTMSTVHIVTRNSYRQDIRSFLRSKGLPVLEDGCGSDEAGGIRIHTVVKHQSKAGIVCGGAADSTAEAQRRPVLFVDDTLAEHLDPRFAACEHVHRFLFLRGR